jgi:hypothetical protein
MDAILIGLIAVLFFIYMYLYQRKYAEMYMSYDSGSSASAEGFATNGGLVNSNVPSGLAEGFATNGGLVNSNVPSGLAEGFANCPYSRKQ